MKILHSHSCATAVGASTAFLLNQKIEPPNLSRPALPSLHADLLAKIANARRRETWRFVFCVLGGLAILFAFLFSLHCSR